MYVNGITDAQMTELPSGIDRSARAIEAHVNSHVDKSDRAIRSAVDSLVELTGNFGFASFGTHLIVRSEELEFLRIRATGCTSMASPMPR